MIETFVSSVAGCRCSHVHSTPEDAGACARKRVADVPQLLAISQQPTVVLVGNGDDWWEWGTLPPSEVLAAHEHAPLPAQRYSAGQTRRFAYYEFCSCGAQRSVLVDGQESTFGEWRYRPQLVAELSTPGLTAD